MEHAGACLQVELSKASLISSSLELALLLLPVNGWSTGSDSQDNCNCYYLHNTSSYLMMSPGVLFIEKDCYFQTPSGEEFLETP